MLWVLAVAAVAMSEPPAAQSGPWPADKRSAIVLSYDDGMTSQLDVAIPQLDKAGFKGTFFLNDVSADKTERWGQAAAEGHELGNHTLTHPCPLSILPGRTNPTDRYEVEEMLGEIREMNVRLAGIDGERPRTMAYPCSQTYVKNKDYKEDLRKSGLIRYARTGGSQAAAVIAPSQPIDYLEVPSFDPVPGPGSSVTVSGGDLIEFVKNVQAVGGMGVFQFHGVGGEYLSVSAEAHQDLIDYLRSQPDIWVGTFGEVVAYRAQNASDQK